MQRKKEKLAYVDKLSAKAREMLEASNGDWKTLEEVEAAIKMCNEALLLGRKANELLEAMLEENENEDQNSMPEV